MVVAKKFLLAKHFQGEPKENDFQMVEETLPSIKDGEYLVEAVFLSVDPYMRAYAHNIPEGSLMVGGQIGKILESKNSKFPVGKYVFGDFGWCSYTINDGNAPDRKGPRISPPFVLPDFGNVPLSVGLGALGMPGLTAYFGFLDICKPKPGETVCVSGAAGAVGSLVGQIAKIKECKVIGIAGSDEKGSYLTDVLGFDKFVNYKKDNIDKKLTEIAKDGIDCYFDNVAGEISTTVMKHMNIKGRVSVCGSISSYNFDYVHDPPKVTVPFPYILNKNLHLQGFQSSLYIHRFNECFTQMLQWINQKKIRHPETITTGFENMPKAFIEMLQGKNLGKAIVKV
ncbi:prostaglandin reductase 1-like [Agrilus planipennis]|uniref:Prostaglandin reductase 1 n=1 Tax=Agrilus planipennis TaxID=224129 RepID=A0A1W4XST4_AGRPL|nr:prostaglandin reductase 1-like [Agrilus planipennis]